MKLEGIHHVTCITGNAPANVEFYAGTLGLRLVKKTVNQDDPTVYHLFYADEKGSAGADITFFEYPGASPGRAGDGMVHRVVFRVASRGGARLLGRARGRRAQLRLAAGRTTPRGSRSSSSWTSSADEPLVAVHPEIPPEHAIRGFAGVRAYSSDYGRSAMLLWGARVHGPAGSAAARRAAGSTSTTTPPEARGLPGAGTVHHVAWASPIEDHEAWREKVASLGAQPTPIIDRFYFRSIYFREPSGVLFEIATLGPGFTADEPLETLGRRLSLPPDFERLRPELERRLTPLPSVR